MGVDVVGLDRMARLLEENDGIADTLFTPEEQAYCRRKRRSVDHLAARFAAKEAVLKAFGTGIGARMRWTDVEIVSGRRGRPIVKLHGAVAALARRRRLADLDVTMSHSAGIAVAQALAVWDRQPEQDRALPSD